MDVGLIGIGLMGRAMASKLLEKGYHLHIHNRTKATAAQLVDTGAIWEDTPRAVAEKSEVILSIVKDPQAVRDIALGDYGVLSGMSKESVFAEMSTVSPKWAEELEGIARERGLRYIQAPVLGSVPQIHAEKLLVFAGGELQDVERVEPVWNAFTAKIWRMEKPSQSAGVKLACNMLVAHMTMGLGQSILFAEKNGVEASVFLDILTNSILGCGLFSGKGNLIRSRQFPPSFTLENMLKDLNLVQQTAADEALPLPLHAQIREFFISAVSQGYGKEDYSAVFKVLENLTRRS